MGGELWRQWADEQWEAFVEQHQIEGGIVARVPMTVRVHCRACREAVMSRDADEPLDQLYFTQDDSSSIYCVPCAKKIKWSTEEQETESGPRAVWMRYESEREPRHLE